MFFVFGINMQPINPAQIKQAFAGYNAALRTLEEHVVFDPAKCDLATYKQHLKDLCTRAFQAPNADVKFGLAILLVEYYMRIVVRVQAFRFVLAQNADVLQKLEQWTIQVGQLQRDWVAQCRTLMSDDTMWQRIVEYYHCMSQLQPNDAVFVTGGCFAVILQGVTPVLQKSPSFARNINVEILSTHATLRDTLIDIICDASYFIDITIGK